MSRGSMIKFDGNQKNKEALVQTKSFTCVHSS